MAIRVRFHEKVGTCTLAGIEQHGFRSILDGAAIHYYEEASKLRRKKRPTRSDREMLVFVRQQIQLLEALGVAVQEGIRATFPERPQRPLGVKERRERLEYERRERALIDSLIEASIARVRA